MKKIAALLSFCLLFHVSTAHAAGIALSSVSDQGIFTTSILKALNNLQTTITSVLGSASDIRFSSTFTAWAYGMMLGAWAFKLCEVTARYSMLGDPLSDLLGVLIMGIIGQVLFDTYGNWTWTIVNAGTYLGQLIQAKALGSDALMYPYTYIMKCWLMFQISPAGLMSLTLRYFLSASVMVFFTALLFAAGLFACMWPILVGGVAVLVGPLTFMFVFHKSLSWIFDGWLRLIFWTGIFAFISRVSLVIICLVFGSAFGFGTTGLPGGSPVLIPATEPLAFVFLVAMAFVSLALLFFSGVITSMITGGANLDAAGMLRGLAEKVGKAAVKLV